MACDNINKDDFAMLSLAKDELVGRALQPVLTRFDTQLAAQHQFTNRFRFLSPAILMQSLLYDITGTGVARYQHFLAQVNEFHQRWQQYFKPRVFARRALSVSDLNQLPQFTFSEEAFGAIAARVLSPCLILLSFTAGLAWLGLRAYRRFPVVG